MANTDKPHGFDPFGAIRAVNPFKCDTTTTALFRGDVVEALATGYVRTSGAQSTQMVGTMVGYQAVYATAGTYDVMVMDDPDQVYYAQTVTGTAATRAVINSFCDHIAGTGSTTTLLSGHELDISTTDTTVSYSWRLIDFLDRDDNDTTLEHAEMLAVMNEAARHTITAGV